MSKRSFLRYEGSNNIVIVPTDDDCKKPRIGDSLTTQPCALQGTNKCLTNKQCTKIQPNDVTKPPSVSQVTGEQCTKMAPSTVTKLPNALEGVKMLPKCMKFKKISSLEDTNNIPSAQCPKIVSNNITVLKTAPQPLQGKKNKSTSEHCSKVPLNNSTKVPSTSQGTINSFSELCSDTVKKSTGSWASKYLQRIGHVPKVPLKIYGTHLKNVHQVNEIKPQYKPDAIIPQIKDVHKLQNVKHENQSECTDRKKSKQEKNNVVLSSTKITQNHNSKTEMKSKDTVLKPKKVKKSHPKISANTVLKSGNLTLQSKPGSSKDKLNSRNSEKSEFVASHKEKQNQDRTKIKKSNIKNKLIQKTESKNKHLSSKSNKYKDSKINYSEVITENNVIVKAKQNKRPIDNNKGHTDFIIDSAKKKQNITQVNDHNAEKPTSHLRSTVTEVNCKSSNSEFTTNRNNGIKDRNNDENILVHKNIVQLNNDPVPKQFDLRSKLSRRNELLDEIIKAYKRKPVETISCEKRDNLLITVQQNIDGKKKTLVKKERSNAKSPRKCFKKIKLTINLVCEKSHSENSGDDVDFASSNESNSSDTEDKKSQLSFLDDFNVDEIVESLKYKPNEACHENCDLDDHIPLEKGKHNRTQHINNTFNDIATLKTEETSKNLIYTTEQLQDILMETNTHMTALYKTNVNVKLPTADLCTSKLEEKENESYSSLDANLIKSPEQTDNGYNIDLPFDKSTVELPNALTLSLSEELKICLDPAEVTIYHNSDPFNHDTEKNNISENVEHNIKTDDYSNMLTMVCNIENKEYVVESLNNNDTLINARNLGPITIISAEANPVVDSKYVTTEETTNQQTQKIQEKLEPSTDVCSNTVNIISNIENKENIIKFEKKYKLRNDQALEPKSILSGEANRVVNTKYTTIETTNRQTQKIQEKIEPSTDVCSNTVNIISNIENKKNIVEFEKKYKLRNDQALEPKSILSGEANRVVNTKYTTIETSNRQTQKISANLELTSDNILSEKVNEKIFATIENDDCSKITENNCNKPSIKNNGDNTSTETILVQTASAINNLQANIKQEVVINDIDVIVEDISLNENNLMFNKNTMETKTKVEGHCNLKSLCDVNTNPTSEGILVSDKDVNTCVPLIDQNAIIDKNIKLSDKENVLDGKDTKIFFSKDRDMRKKVACAYGFNKQIAEELQIQMSSLLHTEYRVTGLIHIGQYSRIYQCVNAIGQIYAVKLLKQKNTPGISKERMLKKLQGNILPKENFCLHPLIGGFDLRGCWCFVTEYFPNNLQLALEMHGNPLNINHAQALSKQLVSALMMLRNKNIVHSDIKPSHILLNHAENRLKLGGFDMAYYFNPRKPTNNAGTANYRAPELIVGYGAGYSVDVWSAAVVMFEMVTNEKLFKGVYENNILSQQLSFCGFIPKYILNRAIFAANYFTGNMFIKQTAYNTYIKPLPVYKPFTIKNKLYCAYFKNQQPNPYEAFKLDQLYLMLHEMLVMDPNNRLTIESVLYSPFIYEAY